MLTLFIHVIHTISITSLGGPTGWFDLGEPLSGAAMVGGEVYSISKLPELS